jgi:membrane-bound lytic murein transglycosylase D
MKFERGFLFAIALFAICVATLPQGTNARGQNGGLYQQMNQPERAAFVSEQARRLARQMSGRDYRFTPAFEAAIQASVDWYAQRMATNRVDTPGKTDARLMFERGQTNAPILSSTFKAHNVSQLIGLYLPAVESAYVNLQSPNSAGAIGMFQFLPKTGEHYGLTPSDLLDVQKSADAAARYIADGMKKFNNDPMKEALALLAYNRGINNVQRDLDSLVTPQTRSCSICALTEQSYKLDATFRSENMYYVPRFFAVAIIGENPQAFGLQTQPLTSF